MTQMITFYEKPGCAGNARQKKMLMEAGITLVVKDMLSEPWTGEKLMEFFGDSPVTGWFNPFAPQIKSGEIDPGSLTPKQAVGLMVKEPILIKRPLMRYKNVAFVGFDLEKLKDFFPVLAKETKNPGTCNSSDSCHTKETR